MAAAGAATSAARRNSDRRAARLRRSRAPLRHDLAAGDVDAAATAVPAAVAAQRGTAAPAPDPPAAAGDAWRTDSRHRPAAQGRWQAARHRLRRSEEHTTEL